MFAYKLSNETYWKFNYPNRLGDMSGSYEKVSRSNIVIELEFNTYIKNRYKGFHGMKVKDKRLLNRLHRKAKHYTHDCQLLNSYLNYEKWR